MMSQRRHGVAVHTQSVCTVAPLVHRGAAVSDLATAPTVAIQ